MFATDVDQRQPDDAVRHRRGSAWDDELCELLHVPPAGAAGGRPVERAHRRDVGARRRAGGHPDQRHRRRPAGGPVRPGVRRRREWPRTRTAPAASCCSTSASGVRRRPTGMLTTVAWTLGDGTARSPTPWRARSSSTGSAVQWLRDGLGLIADAAETVAARRDGGRLRRRVRRSRLHRTGFAVVGPVRPRARSSASPAAPAAPTSPGQSSSRWRTRRATWSRRWRRRADTAIAELRVDGGASAMDCCCQFQADQLGVTVERPDRPWRRRRSARPSSPVSPRGCGRTSAPSAPDGRIDAVVPPEPRSCVPPTPGTPRGSAPSSAPGRGPADPSDRLGDGSDQSVGELGRGDRRATRSRSWIGTAGPTGRDTTPARARWAQTMSLERDRRVGGVEVLAALEEGHQPARLGWLAAAVDQLAGTEHDRPVGVDRRDEAVDQRGQPVGRRGARRRRAARASIAVAESGRSASTGRMCSTDTPSTASISSASSVDRTWPSGSETTSSSIDPPAAVLEDVDRGDVAADGTDAARHLTERARAVRQPDADDQDAGHRTTVSPLDATRVATT